MPRMLRRYIAGLSSKCHDQTKKIYFNAKYHAAAGNVMASLAMTRRGERRRLTFLAWGDCQARSRFARSTNREEKWVLLVV